MRRRGLFKLVFSAIFGSLLTKRAAAETIASAKIVYMDTDSVVTSRPLTEDEQLRLFFKYYANTLYGKFGGCS